VTEDDPTESRAGGPGSDPADTETAESASSADERSSKSEPVPGVPYDPTGPGGLPSDRGGVGAGNPPEDAGQETRMY
jgi:hypothetical protein